MCGDSTIGAGEQCDPPDGNNCLDDCTVVAVCGDGILSVGEQCDPPASEICDNGIDDDQNGLVDCQDEVRCPTLGLVCLPSCQELNRPCMPILRDPAVIRFYEDRLDHFRVHGRVVVDPDGLNMDELAFGISLYNELGPIYQGSLLPGDLQPRGRATGKRHRFRDADARDSSGIRGGIEKVSTRRRRIGGVWYLTFRVRVWADLSAATVPLMTTQFYNVGGSAFLTAEWRRTPVGWKLGLSDFSR